MSDKVPYHAYEKRGKMIEERDKRIAELEADVVHWKVAESLWDKDRVEELMADNERLRAVRDAAVDYLEGIHVSGIGSYKAKAALIMAIKKAALREDEGYE